MTGLHTVDEFVTIPGVRPMPRIRYRRFRDTSDIPGMARANQAARDATGVEEVVTAEGMARDYAHLTNCDLSTDLLIVEHDGETAGYARVEWRDLENGTRSFTVIAVVEPVAARAGAYGPLLRWAEDRLVTIAATLDADPRPGALRAYSFGGEARLEAVLEEAGWTRIGQGYEMVRPTLDDIPDVPMPDGFEVRPISDDLASRRAVWDAATEAFADERDEAEPTEDDWEAHLADPRQDPTLWSVAFDGDEIAGAVQGLIDPDENTHHGRQRGLIDAVFTRRRWRRRGLARALIARTLVLLRDRGMTSAYLGVDGLNPNQAMDLYTSLGFEIASTSYDWSKPLPKGVAREETT
jgi:ribosomal protein S18 acetylase RimI-like enzyme